MHKLWLVIKHEYGRMVRKRSFLLSTIGMPLLLVAVMGITILVVSGSINRAPLGVVDQADVLTTAVARPEEPEIPMREFDDEAAARAALDAGEIQAYVVVPPGYPNETRQLGLIYQSDAPGDEVLDEFDSFVRANLAQTQPADVQQRLTDGLSFTRRALDGDREIGRSNWINILLPFAAAFFFFFAVISASGYMLRIVTDEKENRTMEIIITSMSPEQLIGGKAIGLIAVSITQMLIWIATLTIILLVAARFFPVVGAAEVPWSLLLLVLLYFFPAFALIAGVMTAIGGIVTDLQQGQQIAGILNLLFVAPFFVMPIIISGGDSPLLLFLTLFPTTSFLTVALRTGLTSVPAWQLVASWGLLVTTAALTVWAAARIFRAGMLRYGQRLTWQSVVTAVRGTNPT